MMVEDRQSGTVLSLIVGITKIMLKFSLNPRETFLLTLFEYTYYIIVDFIVTFDCIDLFLFDIQ